MHLLNIARYHSTDAVIVGHILQIQLIGTDRAGHWCLEVRECRTARDVYIALGY